MAPDKVAVIIPAYKASESILGVLDRLGAEVNAIVVVDDACPEGTGQLVKSECNDPRVSVIFHSRNRGVGAATITGMQRASEQAEILVKVDADGQMDTSRIPDLIKPIEEKKADYTKGTRFMKASHLSQMPTVRLLGNAGLSLLSKLSSGYWNVSDPTNGFVAISSKVFRMLEKDKLSQDYFFESDMLFRLGLLKAVVKEVPMPAIYGSENSSLSIPKTLVSFPIRHAFRASKRLLYDYFVHRWSMGTILLLSGTALTVFGLVGAAFLAFPAQKSDDPATAGQVMLFALPLIVGTQALMTFMALDVSESKEGTPLVAGH